MGRSPRGVKLRKKNRWGEITPYMSSSVKLINHFHIFDMYFYVTNFLSSYCDQLKISESTHVLQPFLPSILDGLIHLATQFSSEVLNLVMETLCIVCTVDPAFTASVENKICPFTIAIFLKYSNGMHSSYILKVRLVSLLNAAAENLINDNLNEHRFIKW